MMFIIVFYNGKTAVNNKNSGNFLLEAILCVQCSVHIWVSKSIHYIKGYLKKNTGGEKRIMTAASYDK